MTSRPLGSLGAALLEAVTVAEEHGQHVELPELDKTMALCMVRTRRKPGKGGLLTVSARERVTGDIIVGPYITREDEPGEANLLKLLRAHRWVLNPVVMGDGMPGRDGNVHHPKSSISGHPSICSVNRIKTVCPICGHAEAEWKDELIMRSKSLTEHGIIAGWSPELVSPCKNPKCKCTPINQTKLHSTAIDCRAGHNDDPVISEAQRKAVVDTLVTAWKAGPPADGKPTLVLPRIWAVYPQDQVPDKTWRPDDERGSLLVKRASEFQRPVVQGSTFVPEACPLGILPYGLARKYHAAPTPISDAVLEFWLESDEVSVGWISTDALAGGQDIGYRRELWSEPSVRHQSRGRAPAVTKRRTNYVV